MLETYPVLLQQSRAATTRLHTLDSLQMQNKYTDYGITGQLADFKPSVDRTY